MSQERRRSFQRHDTTSDNTSPKTSESVPFYLLAFHVVIEFWKLMFPKADERAHSSHYLAFSGVGHKDYHSSWLKHPVESSRARKQAEYETVRPIVVGGRRIHRLVPPLGLGALFVISYVVWSLPIV